MHEAKSPLPLSSTLADLTALKATKIDLSALLPPKERESDAILDASYEFVAAARRALDIAKDNRVEEEGEKVEVVRQGLEELIAGLQP